MLAIDIASASIAILAIVLLHRYLQRRVEKRLWADSQRAYAFQMVRQYLFEIEKRPNHARNWRPQILALSKDPHRRYELLHFAEWIEGNSGLTTLVSIIEADRGDTRDPVVVIKELNSFIRKVEAKAFALAVKAPNFRTGFNILLQAYGIGPLRANTVLLNWHEQLPPRRKSQLKRVYGRNLMVALEQDYNALIVNARPGKIDELRAEADIDRRIDIWWCGRATSELSLLLSYLVTRSPAWQFARIRVLAESRSARPERTKSKLSALLNDVRIEARVELLDGIDEGVISKESKDAALTFIPGTLVGETLEAQFGLDLTTIMESLPLAVVCVAGKDIELDPDPDVLEAETDEQTE